MAEILLSLTIIGVVAAITLPSLTGNINERTWNTQRKALYARFSQGIALMPALNGYENTESFVTAGLAKVLKLNNICDHEHLGDCGIANKILALDGTNPFSAHSQGLPENIYDFNYRLNSHSHLDTYSWPATVNDSTVAAFETQNGESVAVYYNAACQSEMGETSYYSQQKVCANFIYDLNGNKGPNTVGKDIGFISVLYPTDSVVTAPFVQYNNPSLSNVNRNGAGSFCKAAGDEFRLPNVAELTSMFFNVDLLGNIRSAEASTGGFWASDLYDKNNGWIINYVSGGIYYRNVDTALNVKCVKR